MIAQDTAWGDMGEAEAIGPVGAFPCTASAARWLNAQRLEASGGQMT